MIFKIFTLRKILKYIIGEFIGRFIAFCVALWFSKLFTHYAYERKNIKNLFGFIKRKKIAVNQMPDWLQMLTIAVIGFVVMETINYILELPKVKARINNGIESFLSWLKSKETVPVSDSRNIDRN